MLDLAVGRPSPRFSDETLRFLRGLKRHNDRDWFRARKAHYETVVRAPMLAVIERLAADLPRFAPDLVASPQLSMYRIYRDTRFSPDKSPYKTHVAAVFPCRRLPKHEGAGLYFHVASDHVLVGGGLYAPQPVQLHGVRRHVAEEFARFQAIVRAPAFRSAFGSVDGERLQRVPLGFARTHPAAEYLKLRQFLAFREHPPAFATSPRFYSSLLRLFERLAPLVRFLNEALLDADRPPR